MWMNHHCDNVKAFVCKRNPDDTGPKTDPITVAVGGFCPEGYMGVRKLFVLHHCLVSFYYSQQFNIIDTYTKTNNRKFQQFYCKQLSITYITLGR